MLVRFYNIEWDIDEEDAEEFGEPDLPNEVVLEVDDDLDIGDEGANCLTDEFGWCVYDFNFRVLEGAGE